MVHLEPLGEDLVRKLFLVMNYEAPAMYLPGDDRVEAVHLDFAQHIMKLDGECLFRSLAPLG